MISSLIILALIIFVGVFGMINPATTSKPSGDFVERVYDAGDEFEVYKRTSYAGGHHKVHSTYKVERDTIVGMTYADTKYKTKYIYIKTNRI
jgi:hypothetical protein